MTIFARVDNKFVPLYRIMWISELPHFCGEDDCEREGQYEVRLEDDESVWAVSPQERDGVLRAIEEWQASGTSGPENCDHEDCDHDAVDDEDDEEPR